MTLDAYSMKITDRIIQSGTFLGYTNTARPQNSMPGFVFAS